MKTVPKIALVVDDDEDIQELEKLYCTKMGYQVKGVESATHARKWLENNQPHLILLDIMMPDEHGIELCGWIHSHSRLQYVPIIMVSALKDEQMIQDAMEKGASDYITKPFSWEIFEQKVNRVEKRSS